MAASVTPWLSWLAVLAYAGPYLGLPLLLHALELIELLSGQYAFERPNGVGPDGREFVAHDHCLSRSELLCRAAAALEVDAIAREDALLRLQAPGHDRRHLLDLLVAQLKPLPGFFHVLPELPGLPVLRPDGQAQKCQD